MSHNRLKPSASTGRFSIGGSRFSVPRNLVTTTICATTPSAKAQSRAEATDEEHEDDDSDDDQG